MDQIPEFSRTLARGLEPRLQQGAEENQHGGM